MFFFSGNVIGNEFKLQFKIKIHLLRITMRTNATRELKANMCFPFKWFQQQVGESGPCFYIMSRLSLRVEQKRTGNYYLAQFPLFISFFSEITWHINVTTCVPEPLSIFLRLCRSGIRWISDQVSLVFTYMEEGKERKNTELHDREKNSFPNGFVLRSFFRNVRRVFTSSKNLTYE